MRSKHRASHNDLAAPIERGLQTDLRSAENLASHLKAQDSSRDQWLQQHPEHERRLAAIDRELDPTPTTQQRLQALQIEPPGHSRELGFEL